MPRDFDSLRVGVYGYGAIGRSVINKLARDPKHFCLVGVSSFNQCTLAKRLEEENPHVKSFEFDKLIEEADVLVDCARGTNFLSRIKSASNSKCSIVTVNAAAVLLNYKEIKKTVAPDRVLIVASGALPGLDGVAALSQGNIKSALLVTTKPISALQDAEGFKLSGLNATQITKATRIFRGSAYSAASQFPSNANVAAAVVLAGGGLEHTRVEIWADPDAKYNTHKLTVESEVGCLSVQFKGLPLAENPKSSALAAYSVLTVLKKMNSTIIIGS